MIVILIAGISHLGTGTISAICLGLVALFAILAVVVLLRRIRKGKVF